MPQVSVIPALDLARIARYCESRVPPEHRDQVRVEHDVRGRSVSILECRAPWRPDLGTEWTRTRIAQLRYDTDARRWTLYWADRNARWHRYDLIDSSDRVEDLLSEIDADRTCIFWG